MNQNQQDIRDVLFGDVPIKQWAGEKTPNTQEPWLSFQKARDLLDSKRTDEATAVFERILAMPGLESRHYLQARHFLRQAGVQPDSSTAKQVLGVVVEVALREGLDIVAAYADGTARYFNYSGAAVIWEAPDDSLQSEIENLLSAGKTVVKEIGPWEDPRPTAPPEGQVRINMLTPSGLHFGQAPFDILAGDPLGGPVIAAAAELMKKMVEKTSK